MEKAHLGYMVETDPVPALPVPGSTDRFAVRRIFCVGRNHAVPAREMAMVWTVGRHFTFMNVMCVR